MFLLPVIRIIVCLCQLLGNLGRWDSLLPEFVLKELMLDKLLNRYLMITLSSLTPSDSALCACKKVLNVFCIVFILRINVFLPFVCLYHILSSSFRQQKVCHCHGSRERLCVCLSSRILETTQLRQFIPSANSSLLKIQTLGNDLFVVTFCSFTTFFCTLYIVIYILQHEFL